jgi:ribosome biogenesis protein ERB1
MNRDEQDAMEDADDAEEVALAVEDEHDSDEDEEESDEDEEESEEEFEDQGSSSDEENEGIEEPAIDRDNLLKRMEADGSLAAQKLQHLDDLSSDDEEGDRNTIGNVPLRWYEEHSHIGYDRQGKKITRSKGMDGIDAALTAQDDPDWNRTIYDAYNDREIVLSDRDLLLIERMRAGKFTHPEFEAYPASLPIYSRIREIHPMGNDPEPKSRFVPSKWERMKVMKIMKGIQEGRISLEKKKKPRPELEQYELWKDGQEVDPDHKGPMHIPAPKLKLPGHAESYNPPEEYLLSPEEQLAWKKMDPAQRPHSFIPQKHNSMRELGRYKDFVKERFERCLDLYLCPRVHKRKLNIDPESLVPKLPKPRELRPFPTSMCMEFKGHEEGCAVTMLATDQTGQHLASCSSDGTVRLWEVETGRCLSCWRLTGKGKGKGETVEGEEAEEEGEGGELESVKSLQWNPNPDVQLLAVTVGRRVVLISTGTGSREQTETTDMMLEQAALASEAKSVEVAVEDEAVVGGTEGEELEELEIQDEGTDEDEEAVKGIGKSASVVRPLAWRALKQIVRAGAGGGGSGSSFVPGPRFELKGLFQITAVAWHRKGDYFATVAPAGGIGSVQLHQLSKGRTQMPFKRQIGQVQCVSFHPSKPIFFVATQRHVRIYNLMSQNLLKKLQSGSKWISSINVHPGGDHIVTTSYDRRVCWFDLDLSASPYKTLRYHSNAVRSSSFHRSYPLLATGADDGTVHIFHARIFSDLLKNPLLVPLKILRGHEVTGGKGVMNVLFHPTQVTPLRPACSACVYFQYLLSQTPLATFICVVLAFLFCSRGSLAAVRTAIFGSSRTYHDIGKWHNRVV